MKEAISQSMETNPEQQREKAEKAAEFMKEATWDNLWNYAMAEDDSALRKQYVGELLGRFKEAIDKDHAYFNPNELGEEIQAKLRSSNWDNLDNDRYFYFNMKDYAVTRERETLGEEHDYDQSQKHRGMIKSVIQLVNNRVNIQGILDKTEANPNWTPEQKRKYAESKTSKDYDRRSRAMEPEYDEFITLLGLADVDLPSLVTLPTVEEDERRRRIELEEERTRFAQEQAKQSEHLQRPDQLPDHFQAMFEFSKYKTFAYNQAREGYVVPILDISDQVDREKWAFLNGNLGKVRDAESRWHGIWDSLKRDDFETAVDGYMDKASRDAGGNPTAIAAAREKLKGAEDSKNLFTTITAINATAEAMKSSGGAIGTYTKLLTGEVKEANTDKVDSWAGELIQGKSSEYVKVIDHEWVKYYYDKIIDASGIVGLDEVGTKTKNRKGDDVRLKVSRFKGVNADRFEDGYWADEKGKVKINMKDHLMQVDGKTGFKSLIEEIMEKDDGPKGLGDDAVKAAVIETALNAFLIDKYSRWQNELSKRDKKTDRHKYGDMKPSDTWAGNPYSSILKPSSLPQDVKGTYAENPEVWKDFNLGMRPDDLLDEEDLMPASALAPLKNLIRWGDAQWNLIMDSRGKGMGDFGRDGITGLDNAHDKLHTIYGGKDKEYILKDGRIIDGNQLTALMTGRILKAKAEAAVLDSPGNGIVEFWDTLLNSPDPRAMQHGEALTTLLGPKLDGKGGFIAKMAGGRTHVDVNSLKEARDAVKKAIGYLQANDTDPWGKAGFVVANEAGFLLFLISQIYDNMIADALGLPAGGGGGKKKKQ